ncbi:TOM1-like protein 1, partial [Cichlidogyrus casuarinus]
MADKDFMQDLIKLVSTQKQQVPLVVQYRILNLIQFWNIAFKNQVDLGVFKWTYNELLKQEVQFPPNESLDTAHSMAENETLRSSTAQSASSTSSSNDFSDNCYNVSCMK